jgi:hypothetical protein
MSPEMALQMCNRSRVVPAAEIASASNLPFRTPNNLNPYKLMKQHNRTWWIARYASCVAVMAMPLALSAATLVSRYSFTETSGTAAADSVGGYTGTLNGGCTLDGTNVFLDGASGSYISLPPAQLSGVSNITVDAWFSYSVPNNNVCLFSLFDGTSGSGGTYMRYGIYDSGNGHNGTNYFEGIIGWGGNVLHGNSILPQNTQVHVTLIYDPVNTNKAIYVNGVLASKYTNAIAALSSYKTNVFALGRSPWSGDPYLLGSINEFRVYRGALTPTEIYNNNIAGPDILPDTNVISVGTPQVSPRSNPYRGDTVAFSDTFIGPATGYYWEWDNGSGGATFTRIAGANSLSYTQNTAGLTDYSAYQFRFVATNVFSTAATSAPVTITIQPPAAAFVTSDITPTEATRYTGGMITFAAAFDGNFPIAYQWQLDGGSGYTNIPGAVAPSLTLSNLTFAKAGSYILTATNSVGGNVSSPAVLTVLDAAGLQFTWSAPVPFDGLNADQILTNVSGGATGIVGAEVFGNTPLPVTLSSGRTIQFKNDGVLATTTGFGPAAVAYPAGTTNTTGNANFDAVLNQFRYDGGSHTITINNLIPGEQYAVQLFALDDRGGAISDRLTSFQDGDDTAISTEVSATYRMGDNAYIIGTFYASNTTETILQNLPTGGNGNINALVLRALSFTPPGGPPTIIVNPENQTAFLGQAAQFTVVAESYVVPTYQWLAGPVGGPYTNLSNGGVVSGATNNVLRLAPADGFAGAEFYCVVSNPDGDTPSSTATLTVQATPPSSGRGGTNIVALNPVAYWPLNENADPSPGGVLAYDAVGANNGTYLPAALNVFNGVTGVDAAGGFPLFAPNAGALQSTASTDQSWVTTPALNLNTNTATIGMWIYPQGVQPSAVGLYVNRNSGTVAGLGYYNNDRLGYKWNNDAAATWGFNSGLLIPTDMWSFVAVVIEPTKATLYLYNTNGLQTAVNTTAHNNQSWGGSQANIRIGCDNSAATAFNGKIDEVAVFNRALSQSEVLQMAGVPSLSIQPAGSQVRLTWPFGTLLEATNVTGPWTTNLNASPYLVTPTGPQKFYRVQAP